MDTFFQFEILGNSLWRIMSLFGIVLLSLVLGRIAKAVLQKAGSRCESGNRVIMATTLKAISRGAVFLLAAAGISVGLEALQLKAWVADVSDTVSSVLLSAGIGQV